MVTTLMICAMLMVIVASILAWIVTERRLSYRTAAFVEARNAAEGIAEFGFSQVANLAAGDSVIFSETADDQKVFMAGRSNALSLPSLDFFNGTNVVQSGDLAPELLAGRITKITNNSNAELYKYVSTVNNNDKEVSQVRDRWVERRDIRILAKATVNRPGMGGPVTSYVEERISVRGAPLFTAAIFYNMDLEIQPGPTMNVGGPVVANGNLFVSAAAWGNGLYFLGPVSASGDIFHTFKSYKGVMSNSTNVETLANGNVAFLKSGFSTGLTTDTTSMKSGSQWNDSSMDESSGWTTSTSANQAAWNTKLKTSADNNFADFTAYAKATWGTNLQTRVEKSPLPGIPEYKEKTPGSATDDSENGAHAIIEPVDTSATGDAAAVEKQKFAQKAGLTVIVDPSSGAISVKAGTTTTALSALGADAKKLVVWNPYKESGTPTDASGTVTGGMYDPRQGIGQNLVELDYGVLRTVVTEMKKGASANAAKIIPGLSASWTGVVYVEVQGGPKTNVDGSTTAGTAAAAKTALRIRNAKNSAGAGKGTPSSGTLKPGLTIATNAPVYVLGHFNSDGIDSGTSGMTTVDTSVEEEPASIIGDAVTILSPAWEKGAATIDTTKPKTGTAADYVSDADKKSNRKKFYGSNFGDDSAPNLTTAEYCEISAAIITGITPTNKNDDNAYSGGAHNLLRYLENWKNKTNVIRGSLVCLYESRVHNKRFETYKHANPPGRNWGLHPLFSAGRFPPGTPLSITFRRGYYRELSAQEYATAKASF